MPYQRRQTTSSSGGALSDAIMRRIRRDPKWGQQYLARKGIDPATTARLLEDEDEPKFLEKLLQPLDALGSGRRAIEMNAGNYINRLTTGKMDALEGITQFPGLVNGLGPVGVTQALRKFVPSYREAEKKAGYFNPNEEFGKSMKGRQGVSFAHAIKDMSDEQWLPEPVRDVLGKETTQFWGGLALDVGEGVALDPSFGLSGATKATRTVKAAETVGDVGITGAKLAALGVEVPEFIAKYGDEFTQTAARIGGEGDEAVDLAARLERGVNLKELPPAAKQEIWEASTRWAQNAQEGTKRVVHAPFLRKAVDEAGDASYGLGALVPTLDDVAKRGAGEAATIFERFGKTPGIKAIGHQGARVPLVKLGTRGVDRGGVKMFGETLLDVQPQMEKASGAIWKTLNQNRIYNAAKGLVNNYARIDIEGDRLLSAWARMAGGGFDAANSIATHAGAEMYRAVGEVVGDDATADAVGATIPKAFPHWEQTTKLNEEKMRLVRQTEQLIENHKLFDEEHIEAARATVGKDAAKASAKLDQLAIKEAEIAEELAASFEALGLEPASADALRAAAAELRGRQEGYAVAFERSNAAYRQAQSDIDKFVNRSATLREQAAGKPSTVLDTIAGKTPEAEVVLPPTPVSEPFTTDPWKADRLEGQRRIQEFYDTNKKRLDEGKFEPEQVEGATRRLERVKQMLDDGEALQSGYLYHASNVTPDVIRAEGLSGAYRGSGAGWLAKPGAEPSLSTRAYPVTIYGDNEYRFRVESVMDEAEALTHRDPTEIIVKRDVAPEFIEWHNPETGQWEPLSPKPQAVVPETPAPAAPLPALDEFLSDVYRPATGKAPVDESVTRLVDRMKAYLGQHYVEAKYVNNAGVAVDFTEEFADITSLPGWKRITQKAKGKTPMRYERFAEALREYADITGVPSISAAGGDHETIEAFGALLRGGSEAKQAKTVQEVIDNLGEDAVISDLLERAKTAFGSGDQATADHYVALADEFTERMSAATFAEVDPWDVPAAKADAAPAAAPNPQAKQEAGTIFDAGARPTWAEPQPKGKQERLLNVKQKVELARKQYSKGLARGRRDAARTAVGDSWESVRRARGAEAQMDDDALRVGIFDEKRNRLLEARKKASAAQTRTKNIRLKQAVQADRLQTGTTKTNRLERTISTIEAKRARINEIDAELAELFDDVDYDRMEAELVRIGYAPERARELREYAENELRGYFRDALEAKRAVGMGDAELLTGQDAAAYVPQLPPQPMGIFETARVKAAGTPLGQGFTAKTGIELEPASYRAQAKTMEDVYGVKWSDLEPPEGGRSVFGPKSGSIRPKQPKSRVFKGMEGTAEHPGRVVSRYVDESGQIVEVPGLQTSTDIRTAAATKTDEALRTVAAAKFEDELVSAMGRPLSFDAATMARRTGETAEDIEARIIPAGYVKRTVVRNGKPVDYILDETVAKWADTYKKVFITDEDANLFLRGYDRLLGSLKGMMTVWGPAFHLRNLPSNYLMGYSQGYGDVASWTDGYRVLAAVKSGNGDKVLVNVGDEVLTAQQAYDEIGGWVIRGQVGQGDIGLQGVRTAKMETPRKNILSEIGRELNPQHVGGQVGAFTEDGGRMAVYLSARRQGVDKAAAMLIPDRVLYNYLPSAMTGTEREAIKRIIPFWAWIKQNVPAQLMNMAKRPGRAALLTRIRNAGFSATGIDPADLPDWMRESYAVPLPNNRDDGTHSIWNPTQFPIQDLKRLGGSVKDPQGMKELVGMTSPLIKSPLEYGLNYDTFRGRQSEPDYDDQAERVPGYLRLFDQGIDMLGGSAAWESVKKHWNWVDIIDDETGETYLAMPARERKLLKDFLPFMENTVGRLAGEGEPAKDARNRTAIFTGMKLDAVSDEELEEKKRRRLKSLIEDELQRLRDEGKL